MLSYLKTRRGLVLAAMTAAAAATTLPQTTRSMSVRRRLRFEAGASGVPGVVG